MTLKERTHNENYFITDFASDLGFSIDVLGVLLAINNPDEAIWLKSEFSP